MLWSFEWKWPTCTYKTAREVGIYHKFMIIFFYIWNTIILTVSTFNYLLLYTFDSSFFLFCFWWCWQYIQHTLENCTWSQVIKHLNWMDSNDPWLIFSHAEWATFTKLSYVYINEHTTPLTSKSCNSLSPEVTQQSFFCKSFIKEELYKMDPPFSKWTNYLYHLLILCKNRN